MKKHFPFALLLCFFIIGVVGLLLYSIVGLRAEVHELNVSLHLVEENFNVLKRGYDLLKMKKGI